MSEKKGRLRSWPLLVSVLAACGCQTLSREEFESLQRIHLALANARKDYRIQPGDAIHVKVYRGAQIPLEYDQQITVQPDGKITLVNVQGSLEAARQTVDELQVKIKAAYAPLFKDPGEGKFEVSVQFLTSTMTQWQPDQVFVTGQVRRPASIPYRRGLTVLQAITEAQGWMHTGNESRVVLLRSDAEGKTVTRELDLSSVVEHQGNDMELFPGDVVFVPLTWIARANLFVEFYIRGLIPINPSVVRAFVVGL